jgi:rubrerythrin
MNKTFNIRELVRVAVLDEITREEMGHMVTLSELKKQLST